MPPDIPQRDIHGRFLTGHRIGIDHRFQAGRSTPNPKGRPWGVNKWVRILRCRRYHRHELEAVVMDDHAPANQREAAIRLLLPYVEQAPPQRVDGEAWELAMAVLSTCPTAELRGVLVDLREDATRQAAAYAVLVQRGALRLTSGIITREQIRAARQAQYRRLVAEYCAE